MDIQRIRAEVALAARTFALVEAHPTTDGGLLVKAGLQTSVGNTYIATLSLDNYPNKMPAVFITKPDLPASGPHRYTNGQICYLHPDKWNPGFHDLTFVLARTAKWLNKYEVWRVVGRWPGAETKHQRHSNCEVSLPPPFETPQVERASR